MEKNNTAYSEQPTIKSQIEIPYDKVSLPSEGKLYPNGKSTLDVEYVTAPDENILTSPDLIKKGKVLDVLMEKKIKDKDIHPLDLLIGDRNAIMINLRRTAYGDDYSVKIINPKTGEPIDTIVDLSKLKNRKLGAIPNENMEFDFFLPKMKKNITFKLLTGRDEEYITQRAESQKNNSNGIVPYLTTRLETQIMSIDGNKDKLFIVEFIRLMPALDSLALRNYIELIEPGVDLKYEFETPDGDKFEGNVPINVGFFWPSFKH